MRAVYGPAESWRLGRILDVDVICRSPRVCTMRCSYCRLGCGGMQVTRRSIFVDEASIAEQAEEALSSEAIDNFEIRGTGEPLLAANIRGIFHALHELSDTPIVLLTNGSFLHDERARQDAKQADVIVAKIDAACEETYQSVNRPHPSIPFQKVMEGIKAVARDGHDLRIQVTFVRANMAEAFPILALVEQLGVERIYLNTPLLHPEMAVNREEMETLAKHFTAFKVVTIYDRAPHDE
jgi:wyosine [tRNA(Phe)-imidazoG37] synthetase (radical SAM superfamily)